MRERTHKKITTTHPPHYTPHNTHPTLHTPPPPEERTLKQSRIEIPFQRSRAGRDVSRFPGRKGLPRAAGRRDLPKGEGRKGIPKGSGRKGFLAGRIVLKLFLRPGPLNIGVKIKHKLL